MNTGAVAAEERPAETGQGRSPVLTLDGFSGPLERLLTLARARQIDLGQLALAALVGQLVAALQQAPAATSLGEKADWVVMAAWLVQLRSVLLLPVDAPARQAAVVETDHLRARLRELQATQALASWLQQRPQLGHDVFARGQPEVFGVTVASEPPLDVVEFLWASLALFDNDLPAADTTARYQPRVWDLHAVPEARSRILRMLADTPDGRSLEALLPETVDEEAAGTHALLRRRSGWTSTFIASLELAKQGDVALGQAGFLSPIHVRAAASSESERLSDRPGCPC